ncbi:hypothetical protein PRK78_003479 [Emydomyces testavorans]|uniref:Uncharacterized protein n=1 Tax=Emydomyces testavorans TaxID=2070801 RepID=A0AAF0DI66_9EURO|nr:hypothetical protein PRK78_003479 [Emydomyces testavorans]
MEEAVEVGVRVRGRERGSERGGLLVRGETGSARGNESGGPGALKPGGGGVEQRGGEELDGTRWAVEAGTIKQGTRVGVCFAFFSVSSVIGKGRSNGNPGEMRRVEDEEEEEEEEEEDDDDGGEEDEGGKRGEEKVGLVKVQRVQTPSTTTLTTRNWLSDLIRQLREESASLEQQQRKKQTLLLVMLAIMELSSHYSGSTQAERDDDEVPIVN